MQKQKTINSFFTKKAAPSQAQPVIQNKRKVLQISSDEEEDSQKQLSSAKSKPNKLSNEQANSNKKIKRNEADKNVHPVDITALFRGEPTREDKSRSKASDKETKHEASSNFVDISKQNKTPKKNISPPEHLRRSPRAAMAALNASKAEKKTVHNKAETSPKYDAKKSFPENKDASDKTSLKRKYEQEKDLRQIQASPKKSPKLKTENESIKKNLKGLPNNDLLKEKEKKVNRESRSIQNERSSTGDEKLNMRDLDVLQKKNLGNAAVTNGTLENIEEENLNQITKADKEKNISIKKEAIECCITKLNRESNDSKTKVKQETSQNITETKQDIKDVSLGENNLAWVEKYKPITVKQIVGQQGAASNSVKLTNWLTKWHTNQNGTKKIQKPSPWAKNDDGSYFKATLLSGPPGVGKTTTASLVCKELGFDVVEFNASDTRSKRHLKEEVAELLSNKSLYGYFHGSAEVVSKKHVLIMDEVDGMAGNEDRGGIQELIELIKGSHVPIICMCNDRNLPKMRSLVNYCYDLRFNRPRLEQIKGFVRSICFKEKLNLSPEKIEEIILATNNDIRQSVNHLCLLSAGKEMKSKPSHGSIAQKDLKIGPWDVVRKVFSASEHKNMSLQDKTDLFFHDYSMAPLFVQQNYLMVSPSGSQSEVLKKIALTADALSLGDLVDRRIRSNSAWVLLPVQAVFSSLLPGEYMEGHFTGQINFPSWLGKFSKANKRSRLAQEIHDHTRIRTSGSRLSIRMDYAPFLLSNIVRPLKEKELEGVPESLKVLQEYRLLREDIDSLIELTTWPGKKSQMDAVEGRVKAALTRSYNKEVLPYSYSAATSIKKKKHDTADVDDLLETKEYEEGNMVDTESEEENDNLLENDSLIKAKKKSTTSTSSKASTSKTSAGKKTSLNAKPKAVAKNKKIK